MPTSCRDGGVVSEPSDGWRRVRRQHALKQQLLSVVLLPRHGLLGEVGGNAVLSGRETSIPSNNG